MKYSRVFLIVLDSVGIGSLQDADIYGDEGANTIKHISETFSKGLFLPNMQKLGLGNIDEIKGVDYVKYPQGYFGKMEEVSVGKDTITGHWELMGVCIESPFMTFTETGFPEKLIEELKSKTNRNIVGNISASGTEIIKKHGEHQMQTGDLIVYTSADSVLQIAAHEEVIQINDLYRYCEIARELTMKEEWKVGRVIARPFVGTDKNNFIRTHRRRDYALKPFKRTTLDELKDAGYDVISIGKICDIFANEGITKSIKTKSNKNGMEEILKIAKSDFHGLCFLNLVDFDAKYGHRRDPIGYGKALENFDVELGKLLLELMEDDLLIVTADHGNDPTYIGTDHTREYVPLMVYNKDLRGGNIGVRKSFADIGATISHNFEVEEPKIGESFLDRLQKH